MKIMTYNVLRDGQQEDGDRRERVAALIRAHDPDILCVQEGGDDSFWDAIAKRHGFATFVNEIGAYQPALLVKGNARRVDLFRDCRAVYASIPVRGGTLGVISLHLHHVVHDDAVRIKQVQHLFERMQSYDDRWLCVAGDFNSRTFGEPGARWCMELLQAVVEAPVNPQDWQRATAMFKESGYVDCYRHLHADEGYTWHPSRDWLAGHGDKAAAVPLIEGDPAAKAAYSPVGVRIDYVMANPKLASLLTTCVVDNSEAAMRASDHLPIVATFELPE